MIEISHSLARRLIRKEVDGRLPEEQWALLQAHLEGCAECRVYQTRLSSVGKDLARALRGWDGVPGPEEGLARAVSTTRRGQVRRGHALGRALQIAALAAGLVLLFFALGGPEGIGQMFRPDERQPIPVAGSDYRPLVTEFPFPTQLPIAQAGQFPSVVAYEARRGGRPDADSEIYLLNAGQPPLDLSDHPGEDTQPAWSPDGQWLAFLSDRQSANSQEIGPKTELFLINLASREVVQLTAEPDVDWQGPLSWSSDGRSIALTGVRSAQGGQRWVYLVPLDGTGPRAVVGTRGAWSPKFARFGSRLAYNFSDGEQDGIAVLALEGDTRLSARWPENHMASQPAQGAAFDWSLDGSGLVYIAANTPTSAAQDAGAVVVAVRDLNNAEALGPEDGQNMRIATSGWPSAFRAVTWTPGGAVVYLEDQGDARARQGPAEVPGQCWRLQVRHPDQKPLGSGAPLETLNGATEVPGAAQNTAAGGGFQVGGLCVEGGIDSGSWTADNHWLVVMGRVPGDSRRGIYAVRMPDYSFDHQSETLDDGQHPGTVVRLADEPFTNTMPRVRPILPVYQSALELDPRPVQPPRETLLPSDLSAGPDGPPGRLVYVVKNNNINVVVATDPDGHSGWVLYATTEQARCPRWSPDASHVAVLLSPEDSSAPVASVAGAEAMPKLSYADEEVYLLDAKGGQPMRVSDRMKIPENGPEPANVTYGCPVWSSADAPGGPYLAVQAETPRGSYLAVLPVNGTGPARYVPTGAQVSGAGPVWSPNGRSVYLAQQLAPGSAPGLLRVTLPENPQAALMAKSIPVSADWQGINGLAVSPDSPYLAALTLAPSRTALATVFLRQFSLAAQGGERAPLLIGMNYVRGEQRASQLTWLPGGALGMVLYNDPSWRNKAVLSYYDPSRRQVVTLASVQDALSELAWSPDGRWLVYSTESGLWGLNIADALARRAAPVWLSPEPVHDLDWR